MEIIIMKTIAIGCIILLSIVILFFSCNDKPNIQQAYDFSLSHWHLQEEIRKDESVEIRFTLHRSGEYKLHRIHSDVRKRRGLRPSRNPIG